jgi:2'-5' RNA ligase
VLLAGASQVPDSLSTLVTVLNEGARACDFTPEARSYRPHVTLSRRSMPVETLQIEPIDWHVDEFCLVWSRDGVGTPRYQTVARWKLAVETDDNAGSNQPLS